MVSAHLVYRVTASISLASFHFVAQPVVFSVLPQPVANGTSAAVSIGNHTFNRARLGDWYVQLSICFPDDVLVSSVFGRSQTLNLFTGAIDIGK